MIRRTVREWERIDYGENDDTIPEPHADRIAKAARVSALATRTDEGVLRHGRRWLQAQGIVGVITTSGCQLEILPKIEGRRASESGEGKTDARRCLISMLSVARKLDLDERMVAKLGNQIDTLLEVLVSLFCERVENAVRMGMPRQYVKAADDLPALRGRLDVIRQFSIRAASPQRLACQFDVLSRDIPVNQVIRSAISKLLRISRSQSNRRRLYQLGLVYADVAEVPVQYLRWDLVTFDRSNSQWRDLVALARLFLLEVYQNTSTGDSDGFALLFDMGALFEEYVSRLAAQSLTDTELNAVSQGGRRACLYEGDAERCRTIPDLIVKRDGKVAMIVDMKWKRLEMRGSGTVFGATREDIYQMMAYQRVYECPKVMLLYPHNDDLPRDHVRRAYSVASPESEDRLIVATLDVTEPRKRQKERLRGLIEGEAG